MSLKGLKKQTSNSHQEQHIEEFIKGAKKRIPQLKRPLKYLRQTFSLTQDASDDIDKLLLKCKVARANRSVIVKAALQQLNLLSEQELQAAVVKVIQQEK